MTRICGNPLCGKEYDAPTVRSKYCSVACNRKAGNIRQIKINRRNSMRHACATFAVVGGMLDASNPNVSAATAAWEYSTIYSQPHPLGQSSRN